MGDRCWLQIRVRKQDAQLWDEIWREGKDPPRFEDWLDEVQEETDTTLIGQANEANYGWQDELERAAKLGCVFVGSHGEGGGYGAATFAGIGGEYFEYEVGHDGDPVAPMNPRTLIVPKKFRERLKKQMQGCDRASRALDKLEKQ